MEEQELRKRLEEKEQSISRDYETLKLEYEKLQEEFNEWINLIEDK